MDGKRLASLVEVDLRLPTGVPAPQVSLGLVGSIVTAQFTGDKHSIVRTDEHISEDTRSTFHLVFMDRGRARFRSDGRIADIEQGEFVLVDTGRPYEIEVPGPFASRVFAFPKAGLGNADGEAGADHRLAAAPGPRPQRVPDPDAGATHTALAQASIRRPGPSLPRTSPTSSRP